jgi:hypothetical protein
MLKADYQIRANVWLYPGMAGWHFVTLPKKQSAEIKSRFGMFRRGWGSLPIVATIGKTSWKTSIFPDRKSGAYLLPVKADVRKRENVVMGSRVLLRVQISV